MEAVLGIGTTLLFFFLLFWSVNSLSVLRNQMDDVIERLERIAQAQQEMATKI